MTRLRRAQTGAWLTFVVFLFYCVINIIAEYFSLNGVSTSRLSEETQQYFAPAAFTFFLRPLLFVLMFMHAVFILRSVLAHDREILIYTEQLFPLTALMVLLQPLWLLAFHYDSHFTSQLILVCMWGIMLMLQKPLRTYLDRFALTVIQRFFIRVPLNLFLGWMTVVTITGFVHMLAGNGWEHYWPGVLYWNIAALLIAVLFFSWFLFRSGNPVAAFPLVWTLYGISSNSRADLPEDAAFRALAFSGFLFCAGMYLAYFVRRTYVRRFSF